jgi:hypothetical protein
VRSRLPRNPTGWALESRGILDAVPPNTASGWPMDRINGSQLLKVTAQGVWLPLKNAFAPILALLSA